MFHSRGMFWVQTSLVLSYRTMFMVVTPQFFIYLSSILMFHSLIFERLKPFLKIFYSSVLLLTIFETNSVVLIVPVSLTAESSGMFDPETWTLNIPDYGVVSKRVGAINIQIKLNYKDTWIHFESFSSSKIQFHQVPTMEINSYIFLFKCVLT